MRLSAVAQATSGLNDSFPSCQQTGSDPELPLVSSGGTPEADARRRGCAGSSGVLWELSPTEFPQRCRVGCLDR
jgi:hypothetical protein